MKFLKYINELSLKVPENTIIQWKGEYARATIGDTVLNITFNKYKQKGKYKVDFGVYDRGNAKTLDIFMAVLQSIREGIKKFNANEIILLPADLKRSNLYQRLIKKFLPSGWDVDDSTQHPFEPGVKVFILRKT